MKIMNRKLKMNKVDKKYLKLLKKILKKGIVKKDRTRTGTISLFGHSMRFNMSDGFPLLTSKKMFTKAIIIELIWFINGDTNIKYLVDNGCNIWNGDAYKNYCNKYWTLDELCKIEYGSSYYDHELNEYNFEVWTIEKFIEKIKTDDVFCKKWGELGPVYGRQWRDFNGVDQFKDLLETLKKNPDSRRMMVSAWDPSKLNEMVLPPCHFNFQCYTTEMTYNERIKRWLKSINKDESYSKEMTMEKLDLQGFPKRKLDIEWSQRSCDFFLGIPFNIASYGLLLHLLAKEVNMIPNDLIFSGGDCHIYLNHIDVVKEQLKSETFKLCNLELLNNSIFNLKYEDFKILNYKSSPVLKGKLSN